SYPLIAGGKVFVTVQITGGTELLALDQATGAKVWGPILVAGTGNAAYENGTLFVLYTPSLGNGGILQAFDAGTGASKWSAMLPGQYMLDAAPTAANGMVYVTESGGGVTLYAYDQRNGNLVWNQLLMAGDNCAPAVTADGVYVTYPQIAASFDPLTGTKNWMKLDGGDGGGGAIPVVANGLMYAPNGFGTYNGQVLDARTGILKGTYAADMPPAIGAQVGCFLQGGTLRGLDLATNTILWSFAGDGQLGTSPILVNNFVFIGSASGTVFGLDLTTGAQLWQQALGAPIPYGAGWGRSIPLSGLSAGNGILVVPAGSTLTAFALQ
ncbi:MAG TPA: PQQ-binding-like beta-propeller repeat protein, partial [Holophagaceae bacterium]